MSPPPYGDVVNDLELAGAVVRAVLHVDVEHPLEQSRPVHGARMDLGILGLALGNDGSIGRLLVSCRPAVGAGPWQDFQDLIDRETVARYCRNASKAFAH